MIDRTFIVFVAALLVVRAEAQPPLDFNRDIRPLLSNQCFGCHGPDEAHRKAGLRLDEETTAKADLGGYHPILPGEPNKSLIIQRIFSDDPDEQMPPLESGKVLTTEERERLKQWIAEGAEWAPHWAYVAPKKHPDPKRSGHWIDQFIQARLDEEGLRPSAEADKATLLRRASYDLTGLPPTPDELTAFLSDTSNDAYETVVDRLLKSPHYGERMAMYWLDLVRYADTVGYHGDQDHNISPYRDYVIDAFNENMPFDQFTREQLAGDLLPRSSIDQKVATGYNRLLQTSHEGGVQPKEYLAIYAADRVRNVSSVWMGATLGCAQCHDHKYDPYTSKDFYAMAAFFADIDESEHFRVGSNALPTRRPPEISVLSKQTRKRLQKIEEAMLATSPDRRKILAEERKRLRTRGRTTMITVSLKKPRTIRVLPRGNWLDDSGEVVSPAMPAFLQKGGFKRRLNRLDLANWLTNGNLNSGKFTARVFANRFWYLFFGTGLSKSLDDFGGQGEPPSHPELLDRLALSFIDHDWNVKALVKEIVMSHTYRQASLETAELRERDPENRLLARQSRFRLPAEMIRDGALAMSGLLDRTIGGASVKPYQPAGYYRHLNFPQRKYQHHADARQWRRGVYVHWQRQFLHPMMRAFDAPSREECAASRPRSNTPTAALTLLNDPTFVEAARVYAERLLQEASRDDQERLEKAFVIALSRLPDVEEKHVVEALLAEQRTFYQAHPKDALSLVQAGATPAVPDLPPVEVASWTAVARLLLNLNETITRN